MKQYFGMGQKLCIRSSQLHYWGVGISVLQVFSNCEEQQRSLHAIEEPLTTNWLMGGSLLWTFVNIH